MTPAEVAAMIERLESKGIAQPAARTALEGGPAAVSISAPAYLPAPPPSPSLPAPYHATQPTPRRGRMKRHEYEAQRAALDTDIPEPIRRRFALARAVESARPDAKPERVEQVILAAWLDRVFGPLKWCHVPNERSSGREAGRLSEEGVKSGVPDVMIFRRPVSRAPGVAIELKAPHRYRAADPDAGLSDTQLAWRDSLLQEGWVWAVCYSADQAAEVIIYEYPFAAEVT